MDDLFFTGETTKETETKYGRFTAYETLLRDKGDQQLSAVEELPIFAREFILKGRRYSLSLRDMILTQSGFDQGMSSEVLEHALNKSGAIQLTIITALDDLTELKNDVELQFEVWFARKQQEAEELIKEQRKYDIANKRRKDIGAITQAQIKNQVLIASEGEQYEFMQQLTRDVNKELFILKELLETIRQRSVHIMNMLNRRQR